MNINIYYGGRGIIDDPTLTVISKLQEVLEELRVTVTRYNLYEYKNTIPTLPQTFKEADGVIFATTVEWFGIGGYMQQFLDACWQFGDKERISNLYMMPVVMSRTYGEREAKHDLSVAWEILGGKPCSGICGYIENTIDLEIYEAYGSIIERKAEALYRTINQKYAAFPSSNRVIKQKVTLPHTDTLSPQESEQLSKYVTDEHYVQTQKEDILELTSMFRDRLGGERVAQDEEEFIDRIQAAFKPKAGLAGSYAIIIDEKKNPLTIRLTATSLVCEYGELAVPDVTMEMNRATMEEIASGRMTFQRAFMSGAMKSMKGDFRVLCCLDEALHF